ncbi:MAG: UbiA-like protein EboC [Pricia sp.]
MNQRLLGYLRLARPANLPTAAADILAGVAAAAHFSNAPRSAFSKTTTNFLSSVSDAFSSSEDGFSGAKEESIFALDRADFLTSVPVTDIFLLVLASIFLYAGGVILNDVFDFRIDKVERPERPIPSGLIPLKSAAAYGAVTLIIGFLLAFLVDNLSGVIAIALAASILIYDGIAKKHGFFGPFAMGVCRGLNLILGMSILGTIGYWQLAIIPIVYIFAITLISRGEVHGENKKHIVLAGVLYTTVIFAVSSVAFLYTDSVLFPLLFLAVFAIAVFRPLVKAHADNSPRNIKNAVMAGVLSLVVLDASIAVSFSTWWYGLLILALLPLSMGLSRLFAVT